MSIGIMPDEASRIKLMAPMVFIYASGLIEDFTILLLSSQPVLTFLLGVFMINILVHASKASDLHISKSVFFSYII